MKQLLLPTFKDTDFYPRQSVVRINGQLFRCECGCNVFTEYKEKHYECNSCNACYIGE